VVLSFVLVERYDATSSSGRVVWFDVLLFFFEVSLCLQLVRIDDSEFTTSLSISKRLHVKHGYAPVFPNLF
jgi:hypothetical protein